MNILVYGAGAIGGYLGAHLLQSGQRVIMLDRPEMAALINEQGLTVEEAGATIQVRPPAVTSVAKALALAPAPDLILLALKSYDLPDALTHLADSPVTAASFMTVGNGIGIEEPFMAAFGSDRVLAGSLTTPVSKRAATHLVVERSDRGLTLAPTKPRQDIADWTDLFNHAAISTSAMPNYEAMKWSKAFLNIVSNASSAILDMTPGEVYADPRLFELEMRMLRETAAVMNGRGLELLNLPGSPARSLATAIRYVPRLLLKPALTRLVASGRGDKMPSFYLDLLSGRGKSEVIYHNGAIAAGGAALGVPTPVNHVFNQVLLDLTRGQRAREEFARQPQRLLAEVARQAAF